MENKPIAGTGGNQYIPYEARSGAESVVYFTDTAWCGHRADVGHGITQASFKMTNETFVRVEVTDADGKTAWGAYIGR